MRDQIYEISIGHDFLEVSFWAQSTCSQSSSRVQPCFACCFFTEGVQNLMKFVMLIAVSGGCAAMSMTSGFIGQLTNTFNIRNTMPSRKPGLETRQWVSMSAFSAVRILPQMSAHDILRKNAHSIVEKCILVCVWFSKCGTVILWSECALLFPLTQDPSFSNRKAGVPTYPGKLVPG